MRLNPKSKTPFIIAILIVASLLCVGCVVASYLILNRLRNREGEDESLNKEEATQKDEDRQDETDLYPHLEELIGQELEDVKEQYPNGQDIDAKTTWGTIYHMYEYENDLFLLTVDGKESGIIDSTSLVVKKFTGCEMDESILNIVDEILPFAGFDPDSIGPVNEFGVSTGVATYFEYKENYVLSISCTFTLADESFYEVSYFQNPNS
jgi:hypothetical protein